MEFADSTIKKIVRDKNIELKTIIERGILLKTGNIFQFRHALFREAILNSLLSIQRKKYAKLIGEIFIEEGRSNYEIAWHLTEGGQAYRALPYWSKTFKALHNQGLNAEIAKIIQNLGNYDDEKIKDISAFINALYLTMVSDYYDAEQILLGLKKKELIKKEVLFALAELYDWSGQYPKMAQVLKELENYPMSIKESLLKIELRGIYYDMTDNNRAALREYQKSLVLARQNKVIDALITSYYNIGWIFFKQREYMRAEKYFLQSLKFVKEGDLFNEGTALLRLGQIEMLKGNFDVSQNYLRKSLKNFQTISFPYWEDITLSALTSLNILMNRKRRARYFAKMADEVAAASKRRANVLIRLLLYYGDLDEAAKILEGKEKEFRDEYFIYLLARGRKKEAFEFLKKNNLTSIIPDKKTLKQSTVPIDFLTLYKKYINYPTTLPIDRTTKFSK